MIVLETDNTFNQLMSESYGQADRRFRLPDPLWRRVQLMACEKPES